MKILSKTGILGLVFLCLFFMTVKAQDENQSGVKCGTIDNATNIELELLNSNHCFDVDEVQEECIFVHVKVNVHFFLEDDCSGGIQPLPTDDYVAPDQGYKVAESLINNANQFLKAIGQTEQWHQAEWGAEVTGSMECIPIRYVLSGVYFHCDTGYKNGQFSPVPPNNDYGVNVNSEINVYVVNVPGSANGVASYSVRALTMEAVSESVGTAIFLHEAGHVLQLRHTHDPFENCADTPEISWEWDSNCDSSVDETGKTCWSNQNFADIDNDGESEDLCVNECYRHPCCTWTFQNNNVMTYSSWSDNPTYAAFTPCQINRSLEFLSDETTGCLLVEDITTNCPPPRAFIDIQPIEIIKQPDGMFCLNMQASFNESYYKLEFFDDNEVFVTATDWIEGEANRYCIQTCNIDPHSNEWPGGFRPQTDYKAVLTVENKCGDSHTMTIRFTTPTEDCIDGNNPLGGFRPSPNPSYNTLTLEYDIEQFGNVTILSNHLLTGTSFILKDIEYNLPPDAYSETIDISQLPSGVHAIFYKFNGELFPATSFVKM